LRFQSALGLKWKSSEEGGCGTRMPQAQSAVTRLRYGGQEDNTFYRRCGPGVVVSGGRELRTGDCALLGDDTIHAVSNPRRTYTVAIHVYGGDLTSRPGRSEWEESTLTEVDYDFERTRRYFESQGDAGA
jgi:predicted metal-dependent enzyme (double-stranded beta helix superfamily)